MNKWVAAAVIVMMLIVSGVEINPGPIVNEKKMLEDLDAKLDKITKMFGEPVTEMEKKPEVMEEKRSDIYKEIEDMNVKWQSIYKELEDMKAAMLNLKEKIYEQDRAEKNDRNNNLLIYGLKENMKEGRWELCYANIVILI